MREWNTGAQKHGGRRHVGKRSLTQSHAGGFQVPRLCQTFERFGVADCWSQLMWLSFKGIWLISRHHWWDLWSPQLWIQPVLIIFHPNKLKCRQKNNNQKKTFINLTVGKFSLLQQQKGLKTVQCRKIRKNHSWVPPTHLVKLALLHITLQCFCIA